MKTKTMANLVKIADKLDRLGLHKLAEELDTIMDTDLSSKFSSALQEFRSNCDAILLQTEEPLGSFAVNDLIIDIAGKLNEVMVKLISESASEIESGMCCNEGGFDDFLKEMFDAYEEACFSVIRLADEMIDSDSSGIIKTMQNDGEWENFERFKFFFRRKVGKEFWSLEG